MKKIFFTALFLISSLSLYSENCYKPTGHIECLLDLNRFEFRKGTRDS